MWKVELADELKETPERDRKHVFERYQQMTGLSKPRLYGIAADNGFDSGRKQRVDKGTCILNEKQIEFLGAQLHVTRREVKGPIKPVAAALETAFDNDIIERGSISVARAQQLLRERGINAEALNAPRPYTPMRSLHPNHVHVFDVSVCIQYYLKNGKMGIMDQRDYYKNKLDKFTKIKDKLLRYLMVDHFSGAFFPFYYIARGESQNNLFDFLCRAWTGQGHDQYPFRGVPFEMLLDAGAANSSRTVMKFLERLGVNCPKGLPYNAARQGTVERMHNIWETWFEADLRLHPAQTVEDINAWAFDKAIWFNAQQKHTRHGMTRTQSWLQIKQEQMRDLPDMKILSMLYSYTDADLTRVVSRAYTISFEGKEYNLRHVEKLIPGKSEVVLVIMPFVKDQGIMGVLFNEKQYEVTAIEKLPAVQGGFRANAAIIGQEYKAQPETVTQQAIKRFDNAAYGEGGKKKDAVPFEGLIVHGIHADKLGNVAYLEKKGTAIEVDRSIMEREISFGEFLKGLMQEIGKIPTDLNLQLRAEFGASITKYKAEEVIAQIKAGTWIPGQSSTDNEDREEQIAAAL